MEFAEARGDLRRSGCLRLERLALVRRGLACDGQVCVVGEMKGRDLQGPTFLIGYLLERRLCHWTVRNATVPCPQIG